MSSDTILPKNRSPQIIIGNIATAGKCIMWIFDYWSSWDSSWMIGHWPAFDLVTSFLKNTWNWTRNPENGLLVTWIFSDTTSTISNSRLILTGGQMWKLGQQSTWRWLGCMYMYFGSWSWSHKKVMTVSQNRVSWRSVANFSHHAFIYSFFLQLFQWPFKCKKTYEVQCHQQTICLDSISNSKLILEVGQISKLAQ